jgi:hypothetical protein
VSAPTKLLIVTCIVEREHIGIPVAVPEYEVAILQEIHGEMGVREVSEGEIDMPEGLTAATAYAQLQVKYAGHNKDVRQVYPNVRALARLSGLPYTKGDDEAVKFQQAEELVGGKDVSKPGGKGKGGKGKATAPTEPDTENE